MKAKIFLVTLASALMLCTAQVSADTVVTAPIDSRPISCEYLADLAALSGDTVVYPDKDCMDFFASDESLNRFADSAKVRQSIYKLTGENNKESSTVIINTSTYFTGGLVGSRIGSCYGDIDTAMEDLRTLSEDYPLPYYYVNLTTPRSLPETRFNSIWRDADTIHGIGSYYLSYNPGCEDSAYIKAHYADITPTQLLMEYSYVSGKHSEGVALTDWERDFYKDVKNNYMGKEPYKTYLNNYIEPFEKSVKIMQGLIELKKEGLIDEIVISTDDLQLPDSIAYFYSKGAPWVQSEAGSAAKYSFARSFFNTGTTSVLKQIDAYEGVQERYMAMLGKGRDINVIYGTDEVPQLIYAREAARKKNAKTKFNIIYNSTSKSVAAYDVAGIQKLTNAAVDFTGAKGRYIDGETDLYIYAYSARTNPDTTINAMKKSLSKGHGAALVELYDSRVLNSGANTLFKKLISGSVVSIADLDAYSAWNTNGNAIGLGVAHARVYAINAALTNSPSSLAKAQTIQLLRHALEDGVYTPETKRLLSNAGYKPSAAEAEESAKLREYMEREDIFSAFENNTVTVKGREYNVSNVRLDECGFPWARTFDCILKPNCDVKYKGSEQQTVKKLY